MSFCNLSQKELVSGSPGGELFFCFEPLLLKSQSHTVFNALYFSSLHICPIRAPRAQSVCLFVFLAMPLSPYTAACREYISFPCFARFCVLVSPLIPITPLYSRRLSIPFSKSIISRRLPRPAASTAPRRSSFSHSPRSQTPSKRPRKSSAFASLTAIRAASA